MLRDRKNEGFGLMGCFISIIIPIYNEERRIGKTLRVIDNYLQSKPYSYEILVVDDGSTDGSSDVVRNMMRSVSSLNYMGGRNNRGKGYTVREGMLEARGEIRLFTDADNSTDISHFDAMLPFFENSYEVVIGSRSPRDASGARQAISQPWHKRILGVCGNLLIQKLAVPGIWDTQNGFKAFRDHAAENIFSRVRIDGWGFDVEALALARRFGYKIGIIPVNWINDPQSHIKFSSYLEVIAETVRVRRNLTANEYDLR